MDPCSKSINNFYILVNHLTNKKWSILINLINKIDILIKMEYNNQSKGIKKPDVDIGNLKSDYILQKNMILRIKRNHLKLLNIAKKYKIE